MEKRQLIAFAILVVSLAVCFAVPVSAVVYGQSSTIVRSTTLPSENVHIVAQEQQIAAAATNDQLAGLQSKISDLQSQLSDIKVTADNSRGESTQQLTAVNRELGSIKASVDSLQGIQQQVSEIKPTLEKPLTVIPPMSLVILSIGNIVLLIVVIVMIFWLKGQVKSTEKEAHLAEHAQIHLTDFIREAMHKGASMSEIKRRLVQRGWSDDRIEDAIQEVRTMHAA